MRQLRHFLNRDICSHSRAGRFRSKKEAEAIGNDMGLSAWQHEDGSWDLE